MLRKRKFNLIVNMCLFLYLIIIIIYSMSRFGYITYIAFVMNIPVIALFIAIKLGIKNSIRDTLTYIDFKKYKGYYRECIKKYSPAVLSYIDNFEIDNYKDIIATLLNLKLKKYIDITETGIQILNNNLENLAHNERYLLNNLNNWNTKIFKESVIRDAEKSRLIEFRTDGMKGIYKRLIILFIVCIILILLWNIIYTLPDGEIYLGNNFIIKLDINIISTIMLCGILGIPFMMLPYAFVYLIASGLYVRSKKGNEINEMLEGLKNYIKECTILNKRSMDELILWEDYLIYSVIFNQNKKVMQEFERSFYVNTDIKEDK